MQKTMRPIVKIAAAVCILTLGTAVFAACGEKDDLPPAAQTYTVSFYDGTTLLSQEETAEGGTVSLPASPEKDNATFTEWRIENDPARPFTAETAVTSDLDVYAYWTALAQVQFDLQGGEGEAEPVSIAAGTSVTLPAGDGFVRGSEMLYAWSDGAREYAPGESIVVRGDMTLRAVWRTAYTVSFDTDGTGEAPQSVTSARAITLPSGETLVKEGYTFAGWWNGAQLFEAGSLYEVRRSETLTAVFAGEYTVTLDPGEGTLTSSASTTVLTGETYTFPAPEEPAGYEFLGWTDGTRTYAAGETYEVLWADAAFEAQWKRITFTVAFADWDGYVLETQQVFPGESAAEPDLPITSLEEFTGWSQSFENVTQNITVTAQYSVPVYEDSAFDFLLQGENYLLADVDSTWLGSRTELYLPASYRGRLVIGTVDSGDGSSRQPFLNGTREGNSRNMLEKIVIPSSWTTIGNSAFSNCRLLTDLTINGDLVTLGDYAFDYCSELTSFTLPASVTTIGNRTFYGMAKVTDFYVEQGSADFSAADGVLFSADGTELINYPLANARTAYEVPAEVRSVGNYAFDFGSRSIYGLDIYLATLTFEAGSALESIGAGAFWYAECNITLPGSFVTIGSDAGERIFQYMTGNVIVSEGTKEIGDYAFYGFNGLSVFLPASLETIGAYSFAGCNTQNALRNVFFNAGCNVKYIDDYAFADSYNLTSFPFNSATQLISIGSFAFSSLQSTHAMRIGGTIRLPASVTTIGDYAFSYNMAATAVVFADQSQLTQLGVGVFGECSELLSVDFGVGSRLTVLPQQTFYACQKLQSVTLPEGLQRIGVMAFGGLDNENGIFCDIKTISIPNTVTVIESNAFVFCTQLETVVFEGGNDSVGLELGAAFPYCSALTTINIPARTQKIYPRIFERCFAIRNLTSESEKYPIEGGGLYEDATDLLLYAVVDTSGVFNVREGTTEISEYLFYGNTNLVTLNLSSTVTTIGARACCMASNLKEVTQPEGGAVRFIGEYAFATDGLETSADMQLESFPFREGLQYIASSAFSNNCAMQEVYVPSSLEPYYADGNKNPDGYQFAYMTELRRVTVGENSKLTVIGANFLYGCPKLEEVVFGAGSSLNTILGTMLSGAVSLRTIVFTSPDVIAAALSAGLDAASSDFVIYVPDALVEAYKASIAWGAYDIRPLSEYEAQ